MHYSQLVAQRPDRPGFPDAFDDFDRVVDALFDDLLIARWRRHPGATAPGDAQVTDWGDRYEVTMARLHAEPDQVEIEATERRLIVRIGGAASSHQRVVEFPHHVEASAVTARLDDQELRVVLPKKRARKIKVA